MIKKFRATKLWLLMAFCVAICAVLFVIARNDTIFPLVLLCSVIIVIGFLWSLTFYIQFEQDRILIRHGHWSSKNFFGKFGTRTIMKADISSVSIYRPKHFVYIRLKDGTNLTYNFGGYFQAGEIYDEFANIEGIIKSDTM